MISYFYKLFISFSAIAISYKRLIQTIPILPKEFHISFDFMATKWIGGWTNLFHMTQGSNCCRFGSRIPGIFPLNKKLAISFAINNYGNAYFWSPGMIRYNLYWDGFYP